MRALTRLRRPLGISAGIWFVAHSIVAVIELFDFEQSLPAHLFDFEQSLPAQFVAPDILLGVLATLVRSHGGATAYDQPDGPQRNRDRAQIRKNIDEQVLGGEPIHFRSRAVGPRAVTVVGAGSAQDARADPSGELRAQLGPGRAPQRDRAARAERLGDQDPIAG